MSRDPLENMTRLLRDRAADVGDVEALPPARDEAIERLARAIQGNAAARRRQRLVTTLAIAAGAVLVLGGAAYGVRRAGADETASATDLGRVHDPAGVTVVRDGQPESVSADARLPEGAELRTSPGSEARLDFDSGTYVTVAGDARVRLVEQRRTKRFALESGSMFAKVQKLAAGDRFVIATSDSEIEVHGTAFRVSLATPDPSCGDGTPTRLEVVEGVVSVRHGGTEVRVPAGDSWPRCAAPPAKPAPSPTATEAHAAPAAPRPSSTALSPSHLAEQNDLFDAAMRDKREGKNASAISTLDRLLERYPTGPLAENAAVERMRLLAGTDRGRAAARDYLRRWPHGFARGEAESLAGGR